MHPLVSIIIPSYNHADFVTACLDSVIEDTYNNKEIVIIDDGSVDDSVSKIRLWIEKNSNKISIRFFIRENKGLCVTLNELLELAKGKYLVPLASDDMLTNNTIIDRVRLLERSYPKLVLVCDAVVIDENDKIISNSSLTGYNNGLKSNYYTEEGIILETIRNPGISGATVMINKEIYSLIGLYPVDLLAEDWFFFQRAAALKTIFFWDRIVSKYRVHSMNISGITSKKRTRLFKSIIKTYIKNITWFPTLRFKMIAIAQLTKYTLIYCKRTITCKS